MKTYLLNLLLFSITVQSTCDTFAETVVPALNSRGMSEKCAHTSNVVKRRNIKRQISEVPTATTSEAPIGTGIVDFSGIPKIETAKNAMKRRNIKRQISEVPTATTSEAPIGTGIVDFSGIPKIETAKNAMKRRNIKRQISEGPSPTTSEAPIGTGIVDFSGIPKIETAKNAMKRRNIKRQNLNRRNVQIIEDATVTRYESSIETGILKRRNIPRARNIKRQEVDSSKTLKSKRQMCVSRNIGILQ